MVEAVIKISTGWASLPHEFGCLRPLHWLVFLVFCVCTTPALKGQTVPSAGAATGDVPMASVSATPARLPLADSHDLRFRKLTGSEGLSQTRASSAVQDNLGFIWFPTQYGLNRYDGYNFKVFKHEPGRADSLSCVYIHSLIKDRTGTLWAGCDSVVDKFDPISETFTHYPIHTPQNNDSSGPVVHMYQDHSDFLWLATPNGLYKLEPLTGRVTRYPHDPGRPSSLSSNFISSAGEDGKGEFWVASLGGLDKFDRAKERVTLHIPLDGHRNEFSIHEDRFGTFWIARAIPACPLSTFDRNTNTVRCYAIYDGNHPSATMHGVYSMLESRDGTMWFATIGDGLLRYNRNDGTLTRYKNNPADGESLASNNVLSLYEDREGELWVCMNDAKPNLVAERPSAFQSFTQQRGSLAGALVTTIFGDSNRILWIGSTEGLNRIDRQTGQNIVPPGSAAKGDILTIVQDRSGTLVAGTYLDGLQRIDRNTGLLTPYKPSNLSGYPIVRLLIDRSGDLWAATWDGLDRFDRSTGAFVTSRADIHRPDDYYDIKQDSRGRVWLGAESGLQSYDPETHHFVIYRHDPGDLQSLSDNRVNSVHPARSGEVWVGTQNGLDRLDETTGKFNAYYTKDGLSGNVVSCILEDERGQLWMGTNNGLSTLDPKTLKFKTYSSTDGLPGADLTGWGSCSKSADGEMFFGGFSGAVAFYPDRVRETPSLPETVLTGFQLNGVEVPIGEDAPLKRSISYTSAVTLTSKQNIFSFEFSALSFLNSATNRYRYKLEGLDRNWHEVNSTDRVASYTTLPKGNYTLRVQSATGRGPWIEPGVSLRIQILPPWWDTWWFITTSSAMIVLILCITYQVRLREIARQHNLRLEERLSERNRIARELHDTLLQSFQGLMLQFQAVLIMLKQNESLHKRMEQIMVRADEALFEGRQSVRDLRHEDTNDADLPALLRVCGDQLAQDHAVPFSLAVLGEPLRIEPTVSREVHLIGREAISNAFRHAQAAKVEAELSYDRCAVKLAVRDDGIGIDPRVLDAGRPGHWGLRGMRERAKSIDAQLTVQSVLGAGTEIVLVVRLSPVDPPGRKESFWRRLNRSGKWS